MCPRPKNSPPKNREAADVPRDAGFHAPLFESERPIEIRPVELDRYSGEKIAAGRIHIWMRAAGKLPDDPALHMCALAYASDFRFGCRAWRATAARCLTSA